MSKLFNLKLLLLALYVTAGGITANAQNLDWAKSMGSTATDISRSVAVDKDGSVFIIGDIYGTAYFNSGNAGDTLGVRGGGSDAFLAKYDSAGNYLWAVNLGGTRADAGNGVAVDESGNVYVTGWFVFSAWFNPEGGDTLKAGAGFQDMYIAKYDGSGKYIWAKNMGGLGINYGEAITVDNAGYVYITGGFSSKTDFDPGPNAAELTAAPGNFFGQGALDIFVAKYDTGGNYVWAINVAAGNSDDKGMGLAVDEMGSVYVTGYFGGTADFDPGPAAQNVVSAGIHDAFVAKYDSMGNYVWAWSLGGKSDDNGLGIALDKASNVYITGYFSDTAIFDPYDAAMDTLVSAGRKHPDVSFSDYDMFLAKYDSAGKYIWSRTFGSKYEDIGYAVAVDRVGNILVTGTFTDTAFFEPYGTAADSLISLGVGKVYNDSRRDGFLVKYNPEGHHIWSGSIGGSHNNLYSLGISSDEKGSTYVTGHFSDTADLDPGVNNARFYSRGASDMYVLKLLCSDTSSAQIEVVTCDAAYELNGEIYTVSGIYKQILPNVVGCDSTLTLNLTLSKVAEPIITIEEFILGVSGTYASYQWLENGAPITGATGSSYEVTSNGNYQVIVSNEHGCIDTSDVYKVTNYTGIAPLHDLASKITIYPNPATDMLHIQGPIKVNVTLTDIEGRNIMQVKEASGLSLKDLAAGVYFLRITNDTGTLLKMEKVVKRQ